VTKAVFFDWMNTLAHPEPDRHESFHRVAKEVGVELPARKLIKGIYEADNQVPEGVPPRYGEGKDPRPFLKWWAVLLANTGVTLPSEVMLKITKLAGDRVKEAKWVLYDDVLPTVKTMKKRGLILGLISNLYVAGVGLEKFLDVIVTPQDVGVVKPDPAIFLAALERTGLDSTQVIYVGDQYEIDIVGARRVGISAVLIDRYGLNPQVTDCPRITTLTQITEHLEYR
jgi:HAD superfamily hydrolase (TIGR01509 family)